jgi:hypothetical protein
MDSPAVGEALALAALPAPSLLLSSPFHRFFSPPASSPTGHRWRRRGYSWNQQYLPLYLLSWSSHLFAIAFVLTFGI